MERLIRELSTQITRAQEGISVLDDMSNTKGDELRRMIAKAQTLSDELSLMTGAGDLWQQDWKTGRKNREIADDMGQNMVNTVYPGQKLSQQASSKSRYEETLPRGDKQKIIPSLESSPFSIRDPDYDEGQLA